MTESITPTTGIMIALLALGLAASSGLNTFLPLLLLAAAAKFQLFGVELNGSLLGWARRSLLEYFHWPP